jgi:hypothetical protein
MIRPTPSYGEGLADYVTRLEAQITQARIWTVLAATLCYPLPQLYLISLTPDTWPSWARITAGLLGLWAAVLLANRIIRAVARRLVIPRPSRGLFGEGGPR